ncbi:helix-turn-helix domain-containing protein [Streptomyces sp. NPDC045431]|uniref:helix-turn-helix domain-containing protein n=1 Tax=Streptomyces sp. NPDC045431 TaxID=3155613 RepID=UPI0034031887
MPCGRRGSRGRRGTGTTRAEGLGPRSELTSRALRRTRRPSSVAAIASLAEGEETVSRPPALPAERKAAIVLAILSGETTAAEAARTAGVSGQAVGNWKRRFIEAGRDGLDCRTEHHSSRELELLSEIKALKGALGESYLQLRALQQKQLPPRRPVGPGSPMPQRVLTSRREPLQRAVTASRPGSASSAIA